MLINEDFYSQNQIFKNIFVEKKILCVVIDLLDFQILHKYSQSDYLLFLKIL